MTASNPWTRPIPEVTTPVPERRSNPWVSQPVDTPSADVSSERGEVESAPLTGPSAPQGPVTVPPASEGVLVSNVPAKSGVWVTGAHGGAGVSTLARIREGWQDGGVTWPSGEHVPTLLVARTSAHGLQQLQLRLREWAAGQVPSVDLLGVVLIADAPGKLPAPLREMEALIVAGAPRQWSLGWDEATRLGAPLESPAAHKLVSQVSKLTQ